MKFYRGSHNVPLLSKRSIVTIGNFDGVHKGHQTLLTYMRRLADEREATSTVILFEPQPREFFDPDGAPARLTRLRDKLALLREYGAEQVLCLPFNEELSQQLPATFIREVLVDRLHATHVIVGRDFRFGYQRQGDFYTLEHFGQRADFTVSQCETVFHDDRRISSSWVREALADNQFALAGQLLGRPFALTGKVQHGDKRGREIGFPTLNIPMHRFKLPVNGVFVVKVKGLSTTPHFGVANIGRRPTVSGDRPLCEAHVFDYAGDAYGKQVSVECLAKLREIQKFSDLAELQAQLQQDVHAAHDYIGSYYD